MYFIIFKKKNEKDIDYILIKFFLKRKKQRFCKKSMKRNEKYKVVDYNKVNHDKYWY